MSASVKTSILSEAEAIRFLEEENVENLDCTRTNSLSIFRKQEIGKHTICIFNASSFADTVLIEVTG